VKSIDRRRLVQGGAALVAAPVVLRPGRARGAEVTLRLHHFLPAQSNSQVRFLKPWADRVQAASGGRLAIQIFPSMQLGGTPPQLFDQARDGVVDIVWTLPGNTPGRFPRIEVFELPFVPARRAAANARAVQALVDQQIRDDFKEVHLLCAWAHDHGVVHARRKVAGLADMQGLKLRFPTRLSGEALKALGASAIGMPIPQVPESLAQGVIDGCVVPWEVVPAIKVQELVGFHTEIPGTPTLYTATFLLAMNKARHAALPGELRDILDANSQMAAAEMAGDAWDKASADALELVKKRGNTITTLSEAETARWRQATAPVVGAWQEQMKGRGIDGAALLERARALVAQYDKA
jgi:TRAP-type C4-dicarboxylate transport system substrate-binding protein